MKDVKDIKAYRGVAQLGARDVWDVEVAGSIPVTPTILKRQLIMRVSYIGNTPAFQAGKVGSIPTTCSIYKIFKLRLCGKEV